MIKRSQKTSKPTAQHTLKEAITFHGKGVHSDQAVVMTLVPAEANTGIVFVRSDDRGRDVDIKATYESVGATELCTIIGNPRGIFVATIEHLMAALSAMAVDNVRVEISGAEVPVMDGSSAHFVQAICEVGLLTQVARRRYIRIDKPIRIENGASFGELTPHNGCEFDIEIDFDDPTIGCQRFVSEITAHNFCEDIAAARTFGFMNEVERLWKAGYALGSSFENSVVIGDDGVINPNGLRFDDEFVRHKLLDAVGDLALSGMPILGRYRSYRGGHKLNFMMLKALFENTDCWSYMELGTVAYGGPARGEMAGEPTMALAPAKV